MPALGPRWRWRAGSARRVVMPTPFTDLVSGLAAPVSVPDDWRQGRTAYGGLSAALALAAARRAHEGLPPLRTAQVGFVGPATGAMAIETRVLRAGKSMTFVGTDTVGEAGPCARCLFGFGAARGSEIDMDDVPMPDVPGPEDLPAMDAGPDGPAFLQHYEVRAAAGDPPFSGAAEARFLLWVRHRDPSARRGETALLALADAPPPAFLSMLTKPAPTASVTWQADLLTDAHDSADGWYLCGTSGEAAVDGYGGQSHMVWARDGEPVMAGRQSVAVFG